MNGNLRAASRDDVDRSNTECIADRADVLAGQRKRIARALDDVGQTKARPVDREGPEPASLQFIDEHRRRLP